MRKILIWLGLVNDPSEDFQNGYTQACVLDADLLSRVVEVLTTAPASHLAHSVRYLTLMHLSGFLTDEDYLVRLEVAFT